MCTYFAIYVHILDRPAHLRRSSMYTAPVIHVRTNRKEISEKVPQLYIYMYCCPLFRVFTHIFYPSGHCNNSRDAIHRISARNVIKKVTDSGQNNLPQNLGNMTTAAPWRTDLFVSSMEEDHKAASRTSISRQRGSALPSRLALRISSIASIRRRSII